MVALMGLKAAAAIAMLTRGDRAAAQPPLAPMPQIARLPCVSVLVPLFDEPDIAPHLIRRLGQVDYPRELLDIILVVEEEDTATRIALAGHRLPRWMRVAVAPEGTLKTKPRALNFALDLCRGSIVGVWDAEDAPDRDQIQKVVRQFHDRGSEVACLQGRLDYYNPRTNWMSRCFTVEYAVWFRLVLPGLQRLGLPIPLGGTTLFFRRPALEALGGWDAHNVTEDADLGIRLARHGYRTEVIDTETLEEANCRVVPWIRQRSRWIKGYMMTWAVHMRSPRKTLRQMGWRRFLGFQVLFAGTLSQQLLAPLLWTYWLLFLGLWHPLDAFPAWTGFALATVFLGTEAVNLALGLIAVAGKRHRFLMPWVPTLTFYFPLAALAAYKAIWELAARPFFWDKTKHGLYDDTRSAPRSAPPTASAPPSRRHTGTGAPPASPAQGLNRP
ncbi:glycosyltransferase family 2 protein [Acidimangrovimonas sediminis]|uniref:glycosyltransferase family 2 protein n=1 Tax=Acidimangrovimonas sediminis TaxID=2056283 RepID=UPI0018EA873E|nr:glycosyltransferase family 2 protein [Acidimangrovimonas sediminis]